MLLAGITTLGKTVLIAVAVTFIAWALVTAIFVPKKREVFPRRLDAYLLVSAILFVAQMTAVVWVTGTQAIEDEAHASETGGRGEPGETTEPAGDAAAGKEVFASAGCGSCHALADAGASGAVGPSLDASKPSAELVVDRVTNGKGAMPSFSEELSEAQIADVAAYVASAAGP